MTMIDIFWLMLLGDVIAIVLFIIVNKVMCTIYPVKKRGYIYGLQDEAEQVLKKGKPRDNVNWW